VHAAADVHDTALSSGCAAKRGLGVVWIAHCLPFHVSESGAVTEDVIDGVEYPTAMQAFAVAHETPWRMAPVFFGVCSTDHFPLPHPIAIDL
jgi:hypothetical protein